MMQAAASIHDGHPKFCIPLKILKLLWIKNVSYATRYHDDVYKLGLEYADQSFVLIPSLEQGRIAHPKSVLEFP